MRRAMLIAGSLLWALWPASDARGHILRQEARYAILLCQYTDSQTSPLNPAQVTAAFTSSAAVSMRDYWSDVSRGELVFSNAEVRGWFTVPMNVAAARLLPRNQLETTCRTAAANSGYTPPPGMRVAVITNPGIQTFGWDGMVVLGIEMLSSDFAGFTHEVGHSLGFVHSYTEPPPPATTYVEYYDAFDIMSHSLTLRTPAGPRGQTGPRMNAFHLERSGWLGRSEVASHGPGGRSDVTYTLTPLYKSGTGGTRVVRVPFDPNDMLHYYSIELRQSTGFDAISPTAWVSIHEIRHVPAFSPGVYNSFLLRTNTFQDHVQHLNANGVTIDVLFVAADGSSAQVRVAGGLSSAQSAGFYGPNRCKQGFVWREADDRDFVCVTGNVRTETRLENQQTVGRGRGSVCRFGRVYRNAFPGDLKCVTPASRDRAAADNGAAESRFAMPHEHP